MLSRVELGRELAAHHEQSFGWALACCHWDHESAEDVLHASYLKVLEGKARFAGRSSFRTWLFAVVRTTAREGRRQRMRRWLAWERHGPAHQPTTPAQQDLSADAKKLRLELEALPRRQREVLHLVFYGELSIREASEVMNVSLGTARTHYERGKAGLRKRLGLENASNG
ncbi:MAG: RNA polymerase sigma factor [bacterium]|nr:RNA polymerase sigma factor [bacterium]